jgi:hypothetical protein
MDQTKILHSKKTCSLNCKPRPVCKKNSLPMLNLLLSTLPTVVCQSKTKYLFKFLATVNLDNGGVIESCSY